MDGGAWRDWSCLPGGVICLVSRKLPDIPDFIHFRAVCVPWRLAARPSEPPPQLPWVVEQPNPVEGSICFYSLASGKIYRIKVKETYEKRLLLPGQDISLELSGRSHRFSLLNSTLKHALYLRPDPPYISPNLGRCRQQLIGGDGMIFVDGWGDVYTNELNWSCIGFFRTPAHYYAGTIFVQRPSGCTDAFDPDTGALLYSVTSPIMEPSTGLMPHCCKVHLLDSAGEFLRVHKFETHDSGLCHFDIFRLEFRSTSNNKTAHWAKISSINDQILFLSYRSQGLSLSANNFNGYKGNSIYYFSQTNPTFKLCRYDIEIGATEVSLCPLKKGYTWLIPCLG